jgi:hypothetical protein
MKFLTKEKEITAMPKFYNSNHDKHIEPKEKGFYIQYHTESGDTDFIGPFKEIKDASHANAILEEEVDWEWDNGKFFAHFDFYDEVK